MTALGTIIKYSLIVLIIVGTMTYLSHEFATPYLDSMGTAFTYFMVKINVLNAFIPVTTILINLKLWFDFITILIFTKIILFIGRKFE